MMIYDYHNAITTHPPRPRRTGRVARPLFFHSLCACASRSFRHVRRFHLPRCSAKSYGTLVGDIYHGWLDPDTPGWLFLRLFVMCVLGALGIWAGIRIQQR